MKITEIQPFQCARLVIPGAQPVLAEPDLSVNLVFLENTDPDQLATAVTRHAQRVPVEEIVPVRSVHLDTSKISVRAALLVHVSRHVLTNISMIILYQKTQSAKSVTPLVRDAMELLPRTVPFASTAGILM
jgi:hypothetical protein